METAGEDKTYKAGSPEKPIKRLSCDPKSIDGVDPLEGFRTTAIDKNVFKKDIPNVVVKDGEPQKQSKEYDKDTSGYTIEE